jgi:AMP-binding enzyme/Transposase DDE domain
LDAARQAGVVSAKRVLDSTPLYDAVATQDTVTMIRSAIRQVLAAADATLEAELRGVLRRDDDYRSGGKPICNWDDAAAREQLVGELAADGYACLGLLDGGDLPEHVAQAAELLATVLGQDLEAGDDGRFRIARRVAKDRVIATVDPDARHGHKTQARGFDGYKGHVAVDPDSEIITDTIATPGNAGDASVATDLIDDLLNDEDPSQDAKVYGDSAYGTGEFQQRLDDEDISSGCRTQPPSAPAGRFGKDRFNIDLGNDTVTCPAGVTVQVRRGVHGEGIAYFAQYCIGCPLRDQCTNAASGRTIRDSEFETALARARQRQSDADWQADYRANRPKVERKLAHLMRRRHGGRRARVRGRPEVDADFNILAAAANMVYPSASFDPLATLETVAEERCTSLYRVPTMFIAELEHPPFREFDLMSLRTGLMGGAPCPIEVMKRVVSDMHAEEICIIYGMTETAPLSFITRRDDDLERRVSTVGTVLPHVEAKVINPLTGLTLPRGIPGELCSRGYLVMRGYWNDGQATNHRP